MTEGAVVTGNEVTEEAVVTGKEATEEPVVTVTEGVDAVEKEEVAAVVNEADKPALSCSEPSPSALLVALSPVFALQPIRPVHSLDNYTEVLVSFTLYGILGVVCSV